MIFEMGEIGTGKGRKLIDSDGSEYLFVANFEKISSSMIGHKTITAGEQINNFSKRGIKAITGPAYTMTGNPLYEMQMVGIFVEKSVDNDGGK